MSDVSLADCNKLKSLIERFGNECRLPPMVLSITVKQLFEPIFMVAGGKSFAEVAQIIKYLRSIVEEHDLWNIDELVDQCDEMDNDTLKQIVQQ